MPPTSEQVQHLQHVLQVCKVQIRTIVAKHKTQVKKAVEEVDRRKTQKILKELGKIPDTNS